MITTTTTEQNKRTKTEQRRLSTEMAFPLTGIALIIIETIYQLLPLCK